ncbi:MAG TPA: RDD family protein [Bacteriovoracaceae bacterium]|nr:RDD family protein [Bacteriovoracaceae bacterium]
MDMKYFYGGFWLRAGALITDLVLLTVVDGIFNLAIGLDFIASAAPGQFSNKDMISIGFGLVSGFIYFTFLQALFNGTVGKKAFGLMLVDSKRYSQVSIGQAVGRYFMFLVSWIIFLGLGIIWVGFQKKKQGWHDLAANTVVVKKKHLNELKLEAGIFPAKKVSPKAA